MIYLDLLLLDDLGSILLLFFVHTQSRGLLDHAQDLRRFHVQHFRDAALNGTEYREAEREDRSVAGFEVLYFCCTACLLAANNHYEVSTESSQFFPAPTHCGFDFSFAALSGPKTEFSSNILGFCFRFSSVAFACWTNFIPKRQKTHPDPSLLRLKKIPAGPVPKFWTRPLLVPGTLGTLGRSRAPVELCLLWSSAYCRALLLYHDAIKTRLFLSSSACYSRPPTRLHDEEVRVVDVELHRPKQVHHLAPLRRSPVDHVLVLAPDHDLPSDGHLVVGLIADGANFREPARKRQTKKTHKKKHRNQGRHTVQVSSETV